MKRPAMAESPNEETTVAEQAAALGEQNAPKTQRKLDQRKPLHQRQPHPSHMLKVPAQQGRPQDSRGQQPVVRPRQLPR